MQKPSFTALVMLILFQLPAFSQTSVLLHNSPLLTLPWQEPYSPIVNKDTVFNPLIFGDTYNPDLATSWKGWSVVENYSFGKDRGTLTMITDLDALHPYFRDKVRLLVKKCKAQGIEIAVVETFRTHAKQNEYRTMGKSYTNSTGGKSKHQYGLAVDVVPIVKGSPVWNNTSLWRKVGVTGERLGLRWGGRWRKPYDPGHFEWTGGLTSSHLAAGVWPVIPKDKYPCIEEDITALRENWKEWEAMQSTMSRR